MASTPRAAASRRRILLAAFLVASLGLPAAAQADTYPDKPIRMVVAFSPGGPTDIIARVIARKLGERLGQQVVVENRPGAGGNIAAEQVAKSAADGYTLLYNSSSIAISPALFQKPALNPSEIFTPVAYVATVPLVVIVNAASPIRTPKDFLAQLKARPGQMSFGSSGNGTIDHLTSVLFAARTGTQFNHIPYKGNAAALPDLLVRPAGLHDVRQSQRCAAVHPGRQAARDCGHHGAARLRAARMCPRWPKPSRPGFDSGTWQGIVAPRGLPATVVTRIQPRGGRRIEGPRHARRAARAGRRSHRRHARAVRRADPQRICALDPRGQGNRRAPD